MSAGLVEPHQQQRAADRGAVVDAGELCWHALVLHPLDAVVELPPGAGTASWWSRYGPLVFNLSCLHDWTGSSCPHLSVIADLIVLLLPWQAGASLSRRVR